MIGFDFNFVRVLVTLRSCFMDHFLCEHLLILIIFTYFCIAVFLFSFNDNQEKHCDLFCGWMGGLVGWVGGCRKQTNANGYVTFYGQYKL